MQSSQENLFNPPDDFRKIFSLGEITGSISNLIRKTYTGRYWVKAEIAKLNYYPKSGHCYPDLVEKKEGKVLAQIRSVIWAGEYLRITKNFQQVTRESLKEGMFVLMLVKVDFHPAHGIQLNISEIDPSFTLGEMAEEKRRTIERLKAENLFISNKQLSFPLVPKRLAIISVETSKGYHDFMNIIGKNQYGFRFETRLFPALLQGDHAVISLREQLEKIRQQAGNFDVALIIRGGGGDIGLNCYDHYELAKDVAVFPLPVITGIGHATNETVTEMVAHQNKITPTDLAYFLIGYFQNFSDRIITAQRIIIKSAEEKLRDEKSVLDQLSRQFKSASEKLIERNRYHLRLVSKDISAYSKSLVEKHKTFIQEITSGIKYLPVQRIQQEQKRLKETLHLFSLHASQGLKNENGRLNLLEIKVSLLEPRNVLKRGYSITYHEGKIVRNSERLKKGDTVVTQFYQGQIESNIENIQNEK